ncbi:prolyl oligopeptidase family serine peptidase [Aquabacterium sp. J223]|uniref:prolyl oligopeptidase family serine peptidase n=1 Tax=Aquabacterium sp. J223 TaxID=2898431 RepID=UPI0021ADD781|nr:prolyl oligopeptidase family serine peptidase [Aquabacterium sp. J223]UUX94108.1 prolyl oligopeptidase family serine peptidase [Aquabacterium sp. J223]
MTPNATSDADPLLWLEDVEGERALAWVHARNAESRRVLEAEPGFADTREALRRILDSKDRIPAVTRRGDWFYNLWQDEARPRGLWRRTTLAEYRKPEPAWEPVLDLDALAQAEGENWVWHGADAFGPAYRRALVSLSRGGADATVVREFDLVDKRFVPAAEGGFVLPEAKSSVDWADADTVYVGSDFGPGALTDSGYPRVIKRWRRGQPLAEAVTVFEGEAADVSAWVSVDRTPGFERTLFGRSLDFYTTRHWLLQADGTLAEVDKPADASLWFWQRWLLLELRSDWTLPSPDGAAGGGERFVRGSLLVADAEAYLRGERRLTALFTPTPTRSLAGTTTTRSRLLVDVLDNVASRLEAWRHDPASGWQRREVPAPFPGALGVAGLHDPLLPDDPLAEAYLVSYTDFLTPDTLSLAHTGAGGASEDRGPDRMEPLKARPAFFDTAGMKVEQAFATSADGTRVPYFVVWPKGATADGTNPTLLYGYGGFEVSLQPWYSAGFGSAWYSKGGVLVVANLRGGGEYGPAWHQAAVKEHKARSHDDFIAVAEDLVRRRITSPRHLGIQGGSNGGLLVGSVFVRRPDLFGAVVCQVPLLDMRRYHKLLAGASWMAEYGDPDDPAQWAHIARYSPYQNVKPGVAYPEALFTTSTRDDRVHPGHARKMVERLRQLGQPVLYYENTEGGHGGAADNRQRADLMALEFAYLWRRLGRTPR